jgi:hypothetical protein
VARYDKYEPKVSGGRARLANDWLPQDVDKVVGVGLNASGLVVKGAGVTGILAVLICSKIERAGTVVDLMDKGDIVDFKYVGRPRVPFAGATPATAYYAAADGVVSATDTGTYIGTTRDADYLPINVSPAGGA